MNSSGITTVLISCALLFGTLFFLPGFSTADNVDNTLALGQEVTGHLSGTGAKDYYSVTLDNSYSSLTVKTYGTTGGYDFDLYVKAGQRPTLNDYDGRGYTNSADETVTINAPQTGTYYIMVNSYSGSGGYNLIAQASNSASDVTQLQIGVQGSGTLTGTGDSTYFSVSIPDGVGTMKVVTDGPENADFDLYVRAGAYPTTSTYDGRGYTDSSDETVTINNPEPGAYYIMVNSYSGSGDFTILVSTTGGDSEAPIISNVASSGITGTSAVITWTTDEPSTSTVEYGETTSYGHMAGGQGSTTSHSVTLSSLSPSTTYHFRVASTDASGNTGRSEDYTFTTTNAADTTAPVISNVGASSIGANSAVITWTTDEPSTSTVEYGTSQSLGSDTSSQDLVTSHSVTISGLTAATKYYLKVSSTDASGNTGTSDVYTFTTEGASDTTAPVISSVSVDSITSNSAVITWTTDEPSSSIVEYGTSSLTQQANGADGVTSHSVTLSGLLASTTYKFRVVSVDASGNRAEGSQGTFTTLDEASSITSIPLNGAGVNGYLSGTGQKAYYTVDVPSGYSHLTVSTYNTGSGYDFDLYIRAGAKPTTSTYDDRGYTESASETVNIDNPSGLYYVMVNSYSGSGSYSIKAVASAADTTAPQISDISVSSITSNSAIITWTTDEASTSSVEYGTTSSYGHSASGGSGTSHSVTLNDLSPATTYHYKVISADQDGNTAESNDRTFTTSQEEQVNPLALTLDGSGRSGSLSATGDKDYYKVNVPDGKASLSVTIYNADSGTDFDLYVKKGALPTTSSFDAKSDNQGSDETATVSAPAAGLYYILVVSYSGSGSYSVKATSTEIHSGGSKVALCIGISDYRTINDLQYADADARLWTNYLQGQGYQVTTLVNSQASEAAIYNVIDNIVANADENTWVIIAFSGHGGHQSEGGYSSSAGNAYNGQVDGHPSLAFAYDADGYGHGCLLDNVFAHHLQGLKSTHVGIFLDHCRSGGMDEVAGPSNSYRYVSEACGWNEYSYDAPEYHSGAWTHWFLAWGLEQQGYTSFEACYPNAAERYTNEHSDSHPEEVDHYPGNFMV